MSYNKYSQNDLSNNIPGVVSASGASYSPTFGDYSSLLVRVTPSTTTGIVLPAVNNTTDLGKTMKVKDSGGTSSGTNVTITVTSSGTIDGSSSIKLQSNNSCLEFTVIGTNSYEVT